MKFDTLEVGCYDCLTDFYQRLGFSSLAQRAASSFGAIGISMPVPVSMADAGKIAYMP